jgi:hypothetical protein
MQCFTVQGHVVIPAVQVIRSFRPFVRIGADSTIMCSPELSERIFMCYRDRTENDDMAFDVGIGEVFLKRVSLERCKEGLLRLVPEAPLSDTRAFVLIDEGMLELGVSRDYCSSDFNVHASFEIDAKVFRTLVKNLKCIHPLHDPAINHVQMCVIMEAGQKIEMDAAPYKFDGRRLWQRAEQPREGRTRPLLRINFDGSKLTVQDMRWFSPNAWEVVETL